MQWATVLALALKVALWVLTYLERNRALKEATEKVVNEFKDQADAIILSARSARANVDHSSDAVLRDEYNLDRRDAAETEKDRV